MEMKIIPTVDLSQSYQIKKPGLLLDPEVNGEWGREKGGAVRGWRDSARLD